MNVPRETIDGRPRARALHLPAPMFRALAEGRKTAHRIQVEPGNSTVRPGSFAGIDLETGRRRETVPENAYLGVAAELRARCRFESGDVRAVTVYPSIRVGELFWAKKSGGRLSRANFVLEVTGIDVARLQDMSDRDARAEGFDPVNVPQTPREEFREWWDRRQRRGGYWRLNPWVWVLQLRVHQGNAPKILARLREAHA